jgi:hypothetical protein
MFQGYAEEGGLRRIEVNATGLTVGTDLPPIKIRSRADWYQLFRDTPGQIRNEYHESLTLDQFEAMIDSISPGKKNHKGEPLRNQFDYLVLNHEVDPKREWKDDEGFSISLACFS